MGKDCDQPTSEDMTRTNERLLEYKGDVERSALYLFGNGRSEKAVEHHGIWRRLVRGLQSWLAGSRHERASRAGSLNRMAFALSGAR